MFSSYEAAIFCRNQSTDLSHHSCICCWGKTTLPDCNMKKPLMIFDDSGKQPSSCALFVSRSSEILSFDPACCAAAAFKDTVQKYEEFLISPRHFLSESAETIKKAASPAAVSFAILYISPHEVYFCSSGNCHGFRLRDNELIGLAPRPDSRQSASPFHISKGDCRSGDCYLLVSEKIEHSSSNMQLYNALKYCDHVIDKVWSIASLADESKTCGIIAVTV